MIAACWSKMSAHWGSLQLEGGWLENLGGLIVFGLVGGALLAPWVQRLYARHVLRLMNFREVRPPPEAWWARREQRRGTPPPEPAPAEAALALAECARLRRRRLALATGAAYAVLLAGTALAASLGLADNRTDFIAGLAMVAVLAAGPALLNLQPEGRKRPLLVGMFVATLVAAALEDGLNAETLALALVVTLMMYLMTVHRTLRALVVPLLVLCCGALLGFMGALFVAAPLVCVSGGTDVTMADLSVTTAGLATGGLALAAGLWLAARVLGGLAWLVERRWLSDASTLAACGTTMLLLVLATATEGPTVTPAVQATLLGAWLLAVFGTYVLVLRRVGAPRRGRRLLVLRVFSKDRRAEALLDSLQSRWQFAGPVMQIGGPDLVAMNLDLHEFIHFVTFRLHELFQPSAVPRERLLRSLEMAADREGRFRINELFCFGSSWQGVVEQLLGLADAVVLDLRGFNAERQGTAYEVGRLAAQGLLPRVVAVTDDRTDWAEVQRHIAAAGHAGAKPAARIDAADPAALQRALDALLAVADQARRA